jgi:hypothetical protein
VICFGITKVKKRKRQQAASIEMLGKKTTKNGWTGITVGTIGREEEEWGWWTDLGRRSCLLGGGLLERIYLHCCSGAGLLGSLFIERQARAAAHLLLFYSPLVLNFELIVRFTSKMTRGTM